MVNDISNNGYYAGFDIEKDYIKDDFNRILDTLKKSYELEKNATQNGLNTILDDIDKINYLDYTNTIRYILMLEHVFAGINLSGLKEFLESSSYLPMSVQYNNNECISLYRNKDNSLIMDNNDYYFVSNKELNNIDSIVLDSKYSNREYVYDMVINNVMDKYNVGMRMLEIRRKKKNGKR